MQHSTTTQPESGPAQRASDEIYRAVFEQATEGIFIADAQGHYLDVNQQGCTWLGYTREELLQRSWGDVITAASPDDPLRMHMLADGRSLQAEYRVCCKDGRVLAAEISTRKLADGSLVSILHDMTARQQTEHALHESEERLRLALMAANQGIYDLNIQTGEAEVSPEYATMLGYDPADFHETNAHWIERLHPDDHASVEANYRAYLQGEIPTYAVEFRQRMHSGEWKWILSLGKIVAWDETGAPLRMLGTHTDISARKRTEAALRASEERFARAFHANPAAMTFTRLRDGKVLDVNDSYERIFGYSRAEVLGRSADELNVLLSSTTLPDVLARLHQVQSQHNFETELRAKSGAILHVLISNEVLELDGETCVLSLMYDITARKEAEIALRASETRLHVAQHCAKLGYIEIDAQTQEVFWSNETFRLLGYEPQSFKPSAQEFFLHLHPDDLEQMNAEIAHLLFENRSSQSEYRIVRPDGEIRWMYGRGEAVLGENKQAQRFIGILFDITERKRAEEDLHRTAEELRRSNTELEQFAYVASHDLQEPLRAVAGMVQLLQQRYQGRLDERADLYIAHAVEGAIRMQALINDLLAFSRVDTRGKPFVPTDLGDILRITLTNLSVAIRETEAQITHDVMPTVIADGIQMAQVLQNLIGNALKFRGPYPPEIHIGAEYLADVWRFSVRDNGIGIEPQYFERIFIIFQRLHTRREHPGTGIGLSICKKIVERHGGRIWVESEPGHGSTFFFTIPHRRSVDAC